MSDVELLVRDRLVERFGKLLKEYYSADEIADIWADIIGCNICPWHGTCRTNYYAGKLCFDALLDIVSKEVTKEES